MHPYRIYCYIAFFLSINNNAIAQNIKPNGQSSTNSISINQVELLPAAYNSSAKINYIKTWSPVKPITDQTIVPVRPYTEVMLTTEFVDGLGRSIQTVAKQQTTTLKDMVAYKVYDEFGNEKFQYLPFATNLTNGYLATNPYAEQQSFYQNNPNLSGEQVYYSKVIVEPNPLGRTIKQLAPGNAWVGSNRGISMSYQINQSTEVRFWSITDVFGATPTTASFYPQGELYRNTTTDEHNKRVVEYKDKTGQILLKKVEIDNNPAITSHTGWLCTYYVYDDYGMLRFVIPPKAVAALEANGWDFTATALQGAINELCFRYEYDSRKRMVIKKVPGAGEVHMVYDNRDRLVLTQDANMRNTGKWMVTQYDALNRPTTTYLWTNSDTRVTHENQAAANSNYPTISGTYELLSQTYYNDYTWIPANTPGISGTLDPTFTNSSDYLTPSTTTAPYPEAVQQSLLIKGMVTGTRTKVLGTSNTYIYTVILYDEKGRSIQTKTTNADGGFDITTTQYNFIGQPLVVHQLHKRKATSPSNEIINKHNYDHAGRLLSIKKKIKEAGDIKINDLQTVTNAYDELGQLKTKQLGRIKDANGNYIASPLETLDYTYNIRGWLTGINKDFANSTAGNTNRWFGMQLSYDYGFTQSQYNGNIAGTIWKSRGSGINRAYGFAYDAANRLLKGDFTQRNTSTWATDAVVDFSMKMGDGVNANTAYDANGNILAMSQKGLLINQSNWIDNLTYEYYGNSNKLKKVTDAASVQVGLGDFTDKNTATDDYGYDVNGNMVTDRNKKMATTTGLDIPANAGAIEYNHLNLPKKITVTKDDNSGIKGFIEYLYDANGTKWQKKTTDQTVSPTKITITHYIGTWVYEDNNPAQNGAAEKLQFAAHEEGRFRNIVNENGSFWVADYFVKDHLGNIRITLTDEKKKDTYQSSFEDEPFPVESQFFSGMNGIVPKPECFDSENENNKVQKIAAAKDDDSNNWMVVGAGKVLKVMAGDRITANVKGWFSNSNEINNDPNLLEPITNILAGMFVDGIATMNTKSLINGGSSNLLLPGVEEFISMQENYTSNNGAYLNWILLDEEQLKMVHDGSGFTSLSENFSSEPCSPSVVLQANSGEGITISRNGYLYIYLSNTSTQYPVYFDNLHIEHRRSSLMEETHYYPFGLTMAGISSKAAISLVNKYKFNDGTELQEKEFSDGCGLDWYATDFRNYDPQIGRFLRIDPLLEEAFSWSPYAYVQNNPMLFNDPLGLDTVRVSGEGSHNINIEQGQVLAWTIGETTSYFTYDPSNKDAVNGFVGGGIQNDGPLPDVTVTSSRKSSNDVAMINSILWMNWASREFYMYQASQLKSAYTSANGVIDYAGGKMARYELKLFYRNNATAYPIKAALDKFYPVTQSTKATPRFWYTAKWAKVGSRTLGGVGVGLDAIGLYNYYNNPSSSYTVSPGRFGANGTAAAMITFGGPPGWITGGIYYVGELTIPGGWPAAMEAGSRNTQNNREILGASWNPRPGGGLGN